MAIESYKHVFGNCQLSLSAELKARHTATSQAEHVKDVKVLRSHCNVLIQVKLNFTTKMHAFQKSTTAYHIARKRQAGGRTWNTVRVIMRYIVLSGPIIPSTTLTLSYPRH